MICPPWLPSHCCTVIGFFTRGPVDIGHSTQEGIHILTGVYKCLEANVDKNFRRTTGDST